MPKSAISSQQMMNALHKAWRDVLKGEEEESSGVVINDNNPAIQEKKESVSTSTATTTGPIDEDEIEYKDSTQGSSLNSTPPPIGYDFDKWLYHTGFKEWGDDLHEAAKAVFPNTAPARYRNVHVLMLKWEDEDPNLPVSREITRLFKVFQDLYRFQTEVWDIKDVACHAEVNQKILDFSRLGGDNKEDLKIVYYAGHGKLTKNRLLSWTSWRNNNKLKCPTVKWSGIQNVLEESQSDVLLLLDCCHAGSANTNEGNGVTEVISACPYNSNANGVGPYSFTHALVIELEALASRAEFSTGELYNNIYCRTQIRLPDDGAGTERHPPPIHLVLSNDSKFRRSIHLARRVSPGSRGIPSPTLDVNEQPLDENNTRNPSETSSTLDNGEDREDESILSSTGEIRSVKEVPRLALAIRFNENLRLEDLSTDLFIEWLRTMPVVAQQVRVEAGFDSFSSLLIVSIPISLSAYLSYNPAISCLGPITSRNLVAPVPRRPFKTPIAEVYEGNISHDVVDFTEPLGFKGHMEVMTERAAREQKRKEEQETESSEPDDATPFLNSALGTEDGPRPLGRRNSNARSISSSLNTITSVDSDKLPPETNPLSHSPEIYPSDSAQYSDDGGAEIRDYPANLEEFGESLKLTGGDIYPFEYDHIYDRVSCLLFSWATDEEHLDVPFSKEISELADLLRVSYNFEVERYAIPSHGSHSGVQTKVTQFLQDEGPTHLKIVYYGGGGKISGHGELEWTSYFSSVSSVRWSRIFTTLESSTSDVLVLLDSTGAGSFTSTEGNGVTELIAACAFKQSPNTLKSPSFTEVIVNTLRRLSMMPSFTVSYFYNCIFEKCQALRKFHHHKVDPIHIILGQNKGRPRCIRFPTHFQPIKVSIDSVLPSFGPKATALDDDTPVDEVNDERSMVVSRPSQAPALFLTIKVPELAELEDLSTGLFRDWLRELPIPTDSVVVQSGFVSY